MEDKSFDCSACGPERGHDERTASSECRMCYRMHCNSCMTPEGICKQCPV